jgi:hypothetical protein
VGHCDHLIERFWEHQDGYSKATRNRGPWWLSGPIGHVVDEELRSALSAIMALCAAVSDRVGGRDLLMRLGGGA